MYITERIKQSESNSVWPIGPPPYWVLPIGPPPYWLLPDFLWIHFLDSLDFFDLSEFFLLSDLSLSLSLDDDPDESGEFLISLEVLDSLLEFFIFTSSVFRLFFWRMAGRSTSRNLFMRSRYGPYSSTSLCPAPSTHKGSTKSKYPGHRCHRDRIGALYGFEARAERTTGPSNCDGLFVTS